MTKNKNKVIILVISVLVFVLVVGLIVGLAVLRNKKENNLDSVPTTSQLSEMTEADSTEKTEQNESDVNKVEEQVPVVNIKPQKPQTGVADKNPSIAVVDGWLNVVSSSEYNGKLSFTFENISDKDVELAVVQCKVGRDVATFKITGLIRNAKVKVECLEDIKYKKKALYENWSVLNKADYSTPRELNKDIFEIKGNDGSLTIKNISDKDIDSTIFICYKKSEKDVLVGSEIYRVRVNGLKKGESASVFAKSFTLDGHRIIFVDYEH